MLTRVAIDKPQHITSAQVVRDLQRAFNRSRLFAPLLAAEKASRDNENRFQKKRRRDKRLQVKIGHGGTLDPIATGVLVIGVGKGTKQLQKFLECTKTYEATLLFGASTDTFDVVGKLLETAPYAHITCEKVQDALEIFTGNIKQRPPIYSSLRLQGKRLYEYAREGKELPQAIQERPVRVDELRIVEWLNPKTHGFKWPTEEAEPDSKELARTVAWLGCASPTASEDKTPDTRLKRKRSTASEASVTILEDALPDSKRREAEHPIPMPDLSVERLPLESARVFSSEDFPSANSGTIITRDDQGPPAVKLKMTVTSGFYVRSLCHDLGKALSSRGLMVALARTRQGDFELGQNVLAYDDLAHEEDVWAPKVQAMLEAWGHSRSVSIQNPQQETSPNRQHGVS